MPSRPLALAAITLLAACSTPTDVPLARESSVTASVVDIPVRDAVLRWNEVATGMTARADIPAPLPPLPEAPFYAMTFAAVHDALNAIDRRYEPYVYTGSAAGPVNAAAAVAAAAHGVLAAVATGIANDPVFPNPKPLQFVEAAYAADIGAIPDGAAKTAGIALGEAVAGAVLASRAGDGSAGLGLTPFQSSGLPGVYRPTPPFAFDPQNLNGLSDSPGWGQVRPFVLQDASAFRAPAPYGFDDPSRAVLTPGYTRDLAEVKRLGGAVSERTPEQTATAFFWIENSPRGWNRVARTLGIARGLDGWQLAHCFALLQLAEADSYIVSFESKFHYRFWRPITAIRFAADDGNDATVADPTWDVASSLFGVPTPPVPDYPSAHSSAGGAAEAVLKSVFPGRTGFTMESTTLPGSPRTFASVTDAARENAESRVLVGYHFRQATDVGLRQGREVGRYVATRALRPIGAEHANAAQR